MTGNVRRCTAALATAGLLALPACSDDKADQPRALPPVTASPTASGPVAPTMPAAAKQHTREGAEAFARYFINVTNYAQQTGDTTPVEALADKDCGSCAQFVSDVREWYREGSVRGGLLTITRARTPELRSGYTPVSVLDIEVGTVERLDKRGDPAGPLRPGFSAQLFVDLKWANGEWKVAEARMNQGDQPT